MVYFSKVYATAAEQAERAAIFESNVAGILAHNELWRNGETTYYLRVNQFADLTSEEFISTKLGGGQFQNLPDSSRRFKRNSQESLKSFRSSYQDNYVSDYQTGGSSYYEPEYESNQQYSYYDYPHRQTKRQIPDLNTGIPFTTILDWEEQGGMNPVRDQICNSCAAHTAIAILENCIWRKTGRLPEPLSVQQLLTCTENRILGEKPIQHWNTFCDSGFSDIHLDYLRELAERGSNFQLERDNPEVGNKSIQCLRNIPSANLGVRVTESEGKWFRTEAEMEEALNFGAVETRIDVRTTGVFVDIGRLIHIQHYGGGPFYNGSECVDSIVEDVPQECLQDGIPGTYTCHTPQLACNKLLPDHCNRFFVPSAEVLQHSVTVVGTGFDDMGDGRIIEYWRIKNSWGEDWGEGGYLRLFRGRGHCGVGSSYTRVDCEVF